MILGVFKKNGSISVFPKLFEPRHAKINMKSSRIPYQHIFTFFPHEIVGYGKCNETDLGNTDIHI
jgi:hypothetical protein